MENLTTGQVAKKARVNIETIRYYERRGLIDKPMRTESGYRSFPAEAVERIQFIKNAQELGFSLNEIKELLQLKVDPLTPSSEIRQRTVEKVKDIEAKIASLEKMKHSLLGLIGACDGEGTVAECPIIESLQNGGGTDE